MQQKVILPKYDAMLAVTVMRKQAYRLVFGCLNSTTQSSFTS